MAEKLRILVSNDDGYDAPGILSLKRALTDIADVEVVAPMENQSGVSSKICLDESIAVNKIEANVHAVAGTPADCVQLALQPDNKFQLPWWPDLTVTGINSGANLGEGTFYSGTVAAALESILAGVPAVAFSLVCMPVDNFPPRHFDDAADLAKDMVQKLASSLRSNPGTLLNVNIPDLPRANIKGPLVCKLGRRYPHRPVLEVRQATETQREFFLGTNDYEADGKGDDFTAVKNHHVAVTPLQFDFTDTSIMEQTEQWLT